MKLKALAFLTVTILAGSHAVAGDKGCCAGMAKSDMKAACAATFANLNLSSEQKSKMEKLSAECDKGGCNEASMAEMEKQARGILTEEQLAAWKAACAARKSEKKQS